MDDLRISHRPLVSMLHCQTLEDAQLVALEGEHAHTKHHRPNCGSQGGGQSSLRGGSKRQTPDVLAIVHGGSADSAISFTETDIFPSQQRPTFDHQQSTQ